MFGAARNTARTARLFSLTADDESRTEISTLLIKSPFCIFSKLPGSPATVHSKHLLHSNKHAVLCITAVLCIVVDTAHIAAASVEWLI